ncbi:MAG TPA: hypothetical protein VLA50_00055 [Erythrobacter sp.]|nr:hypothetical protein [Erythrobacter sp.]
MLRLLILALCLLASPAHALCTSASLVEDFRQADLVVRVVVTAETLVTDDEPNAAFVARWGDYSPVVLHRLRVVEAFKGRPGPSVRLFQTVDSGRYGLGVGEEHLLFLSYHQPAKSRPAAARGATYVRHTCGLSNTWKSVAPNVIELLRRRKTGR